MLPKQFQFNGDFQLNRKIKHSKWLRNRLSWFSIHNNLNAKCMVSRLKLKSASIITPVYLPLNMPKNRKITRINAVNAIDTIFNIVFRPNTNINGTFQMRKTNILIKLQQHINNYFVQIFNIWSAVMYCDVEFLLFSSVFFVHQTF